MMTLFLLLIYFALLFVIGKITARGATNRAFFAGNRSSSWQLVAFGMVGASVSGVTFVSVPGMAMRSDMTYLQTCMGFILGYFLVAFVLLPVYYRMNLTTIYTYLSRRFGDTSRLTGSCFFLVSKTISTAVKLYVVCIIMHQMLMADTDRVGEGSLSFVLTAIVMVALVWGYSRRGGIKTLVLTDTIQTACILLALVMIIISVIGQLDMSLAEAFRAVVSDSHSRIFVFDDWMSRQNFWKQFVSGAFIVVVMTGLDQDMMQKNLTCKSLREAQKDMCTYGFAFLPANALFLVLGILLMLLAARQGLVLPQSGDELLPMFAATGRLGELSKSLFVLGIAAASFSSADSALTALTTCYCVDIKGASRDERLRKRVHLLMALVLVAVMLLFRWLNNTSVIDAIYIIVGYTYGPLLGLFAFGLFTKLKVRDSWVPVVAVASPVVCYVIDTISSNAFGYKFGYELLLLNGMITFAGLWLLKTKR